MQVSVARRIVSSPPPTPSFQPYAGRFSRVMLFDGLTARAGRKSRRHGRERARAEKAATCR